MSRTKWNKNPFLLLMGQALAKFIVTFFFIKTLSRSPATGSTSSKYLLKSTVFLHTHSLFHLVLTALYFQQGQVMLTVDENVLLINMMDLMGEVWDHFYQWETLLFLKKNHPSRYRDRRRHEKGKIAFKILVSVLLAGGRQQKNPLFSKIYDCASEDAR